MPSAFPHESLDCYRLAVSVARWVAATRFPARNADLADQALRAAQSVVLNIAEGAARHGPAARNHFRIALGSAAETSAVLDLVDLPDAPLRQAELRRVGAMLRGLAR
jgi:four helix bundle protein